MKWSNPKSVPLVAGITLALVSGAAMAHSGGPHEAGLAAALAHFLTSWHHLLGGMAVVATAIVLGRTLKRVRGPGRATRPSRRLDR